MATSTINFQEFDVRDLDDINPRWTKWTTKLERYFVHEEETDDKKKVNALFLFGGYDLEELYNQYKEDTDTYEEIIKKITAHFNPKTNAQLNRFNFRELAQLIK